MSTDQELFTVRQWVDASFPDPTWIINPLMEAGTGAWLHGPPQSFKSFFLLQLCIDVAAGVRPLDVWGEHEAVPTLFFQAEGTRRGWKHRIVAAMEANALSIPFYSEHQMSVKVDSREGRAWVEARIKASKAKLVVFDPLVTWFTGNDSDPVAIREWLDVLNYWRGVYDVAIIIGHHDRQPTHFYSKSAGKMLTLDAGAEEMRGRTELFGWADLILGLKKSDNLATLTIQKSRESVTGDKHTFRLQEITPGAVKLVVNSRANELETTLTVYLANGDNALGVVVTTLAKELNKNERTIRRQIEKLVSEGKFELVGDGARKALRIVEE